MQRATVFLAKPPVHTLSQIAFHELGRRWLLVPSYTECQSLYSVPHSTLHLQIGFDKLGAGQNATVAVMSYSGYDIEDAIVMNKASLDRGFGRCIVIRRYATSLRKYANRTQDRIVAPPGGPLGASQRYALLDADGIAAAGEMIRPGDVYVNKQSPKNTREMDVPNPANLPDR